MTFTAADDLKTPLRTLRERLTEATFVLRLMEDLEAREDNETPDESARQAMVQDTLTYVGQTMQEYLHGGAQMDTPAMTPLTDECEPLLNTKQLATYLDVDTRTIYRYIKVFDLPTLRPGGRLAFLKSDIDTWMKTRGRDARRGQRDE